MGDSPISARHPRAARHGDPLDIGSLHPLGQLSVLVRARVEAVAERHGLTAMQGRLLGLIDDGPRPMAELAAALAIEKATLTGLVGRAESRGLARREMVPGNRRSTQVHLTARGAEASTAFYAELATALDAMLSVLPEADRAGYTASTVAIIESAGAALDRDRP